MEKVKVTQEQADAIDHAKWLYHTYPDIVERYVNGKIGKDILDIPLGQLMGALYIGYEVEPEFKVGDWVVSLEFKAVKKIEGIEKPEEQLTIYRLEDKFHVYTIRHATPEEIQQEKERRWWAKHGREVWELKSGDVLYYTDTNEVSIVDSFKGSCVYFQDTNCDSVKELKNYYKVVCFAGNRLDNGDLNES